MMKGHELLYTEELASEMCACVGPHFFAGANGVKCASFQVRKAIRKGSVPKGVEHVTWLSWKSSSALRHLGVSCKVTFCHTAFFPSGNRMFSSPGMLEAKTEVKKTIVC